MKHNKPNQLVETVKHGYEAHGWTWVPGVCHEFVPLTGECIIGEVSTANDDLHDNFCLNPDIERYPGIIKDVPPLVPLIGDIKSSRGQQSS